MKRNASIELWRCLCMLAVVCGHVVVNNGVGSTAGWIWHIPGFLVITAFFGIKFKWIKVLKLLGICYACYWLTIPLRGGSVNIVNLALPHGGWFVPFYVVLMMLSPILNAAISTGESHHRQMAVVVGALLLFAWCPCFCSRLSMMKIAGMQGHGLLLMISIYILGRLFAVHGLLKRIGKVSAACLFGVGVGLQIIVYGRFPEAGSYVSPLSIATAFAGFSFVANIQLPKWIAAPVLFLAPSMFGVCLLHECCLRNWQYSDFVARSYGRAIAWAFCLFVACVALDLMRRFLFYVVETLWERLCRAPWHLRLRHKFLKDA